MRRNLCAMLVLGLALAGSAWGQAAYPSKPLRLVVGFPPGGYTPLIGASGAMAFNPGQYAKLPYDPLRDFAR